MNQRGRLAFEVHWSNLWREEASAVDGGEGCREDGCCEFFLSGL